MKYILGDLLASDERIIAHGCNAQGVMGSGIAKAIRDKYPECYNVYHRKYLEDGEQLTLGDTIFYYHMPFDTNGIPARIIGNCITQNLFGRTGNCFVDYDAIAESVYRVFELAQGTQIKSVGLPLIGAGLGGGDWNRIEEIIIRCSYENEIEANVYLIDKELYEKYDTK